MEVANLGGWLMTWVRLLVTTYGLTGQIRDDLKVAAYCVHFGICRHIIVEVQASDGQPSGAAPTNITVSCSHRRLMPFVIAAIESD